MKIENVQVEQISKNHFRIITSEGQYLQSCYKLVAFIDNKGKRYIDSNYLSYSTNRINYIARFFNLTKRDLYLSYKNGTIKTI
mgnify:CR=1 FL=1